VTIDGDPLRDLLRSLDDPEHLEFPADFDRGKARGQFDQLADRLDAAFSCTCEADRHVQDASFLGRIEIPAAAAASGRRLVIVASNFGGLAVVTVDNPGAWSQEEADALLHPDDAGRVHAALNDTGYTVVPEEPLWQPYEGDSPLRTCYPGNAATWWTRFFDYL